nr:thiolase family protein [uncultured Albidiferax sp.]
MREVFVIGVGMTPFNRHLDKTCADLARAAVQAALADARLAMADVQSVFYANTALGAIEGQMGIKAQHALRPMGFDGIPMVNVEDACSGSAVALNLAITQVQAGNCDVALAVGAEKLNTKDSARRTSAFSQPEDVASVRAFVEQYMPLAEATPVPPEVVVDPAMRSIFMDAYAINARLHMAKYGSTWRQMAAVSSKNHGHSTMNPLAQFQSAMSVEEIMAARVISWPLTLPMCSPISDGASAVLVCSSEALRRVAAARPVRVLASVVRGGSNRAIDDTNNAAVRLTALTAYERAGIGPQDVSVAEVHDASAYAEIAHTEFLGLCDTGTGGFAAERGETTLGGRIPVNVSGGLQSRGHPVAATGLAQIHELVTQLRGEAGKRQVEGASIGIASNGGGFIGVEDAVCCVTILGK